MPHPDWLYDRRSCQTCVKARADCHTRGVSAAEVVNAAKTRLGPADALALLAGIDAVIATRGRKVVRFDLAGDRPDDETLLRHLIGPSGNLRAPTMRVGRVLVVGHDAAVYAEVLGDERPGPS